jgi:hypothetical protein
MMRQPSVMTKSGRVMSGCALTVSNNISASQSCCSHPQTPRLLQTTTHIGHQALTPCH